MPMQYKNYKAKNIIEESRPEQWFFVIISYIVGAALKGSFNWLVFLLLTFPYNLFVYRLDDWLEDRLGKGNYEIISAPLYYIFPFMLGYGLPSIYLLVGLYFFYFSVNSVHSIGHKEINLKWAYVLLPLAIISAYILSDTIFPKPFLYSFLVLGFSQLVLLLFKQWRDDYWIALFGCYVGVSLAFSILLVEDFCV